MLTHAALLTLLAAPQSPQEGTGVGQVFPDIELPRIDGQGSVRLSELRGTKLLLIEFASW